LAVSAAAVVVTLLPTACSTAFADDESDGQRPANASVSEILSSQGRDQDDGDRRRGRDENNDDENNNNDNEEEAPPAEEPPAEEPPAEDPAAEDPAAEEPPAEAPEGEGPGVAEPGVGDTGNAEPGAGEGGQPNDGNAQGGNNDGAQDQINGLDVLGRDCTNSQLPPHDGFQEAPRCVDTAFGEVAAEERSPSLLITEAPANVAVGEDFTISVSTQNLIRDRFLGAAQGGYYLESSFLNEEGLQRGHFHTACRLLESVDVAPDAAPAPEFFLATQDNAGGAEPDTVEITVTGMPAAGTAQCAVWAGDGSHRIPMMQRANQTPAFDTIRITVQ
jgi:hypothetical protein